MTDRLHELHSDRTEEDAYWWDEKQLRGGRIGGGGGSHWETTMGKIVPLTVFFSSSRMKALQEREDAVVHAALPMTSAILAWCS